MPDLITTGDLLEDNSEQLVQTKRQLLEEYIDKVVMKQPRGPERWKAAKRMAIDLNFSGTEGLTAEEENRLVEEDNATERQFNYLNNKGFDTSDDSNSDIRGVFNMPYYVHMMIRMVDPEAFDKENTAQMVKTFPEYLTAEKF